MGDTCVRLLPAARAGAAQYSGSNLQAYLGVDNGKKTVPLPVGAIKPQELSKTTTAMQGSTYTWTVDKSATPATVDFPNRLPGGRVAQHRRGVHGELDRSATIGAGLISLHTEVTATNPAHGTSPSR